MERNELHVGGGKNKLLKRIQGPYCGLLCQRIQGRKGKSKGARVLWDRGSTSQTGSQGDPDQPSMPKTKKEYGEGISKETS